MWYHFFVLLKIVSTPPHHTLIICLITCVKCSIEWSGKRAGSISRRYSLDGEATWNKFSLFHSACGQESTIYRKCDPVDHITFVAQKIQASVDHIFDLCWRRLSMMLFLLLLMLLFIVVIFVVRWRCKRKKKVENYNSLLK